MIMMTNTTVNSQKFSFSSLSHPAINVHITWLFSILASSKYFNWCCLFPELLNLYFILAASINACSLLPLTRPEQWAFVPALCLCELSAYLCAILACLCAQNIYWFHLCTFVQVWYLVLCLRLFVSFATLLWVYFTYKQYACISTSVVCIGFNAQCTALWWMQAGFTLPWVCIGSTACCCQVKLLLSTLSVTMYKHWRSGCILLGEKTLILHQWCRWCYMDQEGRNITNKKNASLLCHAV